MWGVEKMMLQTALLLNDRKAENSQGPKIMNESGADFGGKRRLLYITEGQVIFSRTALMARGWEVVVPRDDEDLLDISSRLGINVGLVDFTDEHWSRGARDVLDHLPPSVRWIALISRERLKKTEISGAIARACYDYHTLPVDFERLLITLGRANGMARLHQTSTESQPRRNYNHGLVGDSAAITALRRTVDKLASAEAPVLITGESGTGKELVASAIHSSSPRKDKPFIPVNCGAIPASLFQSELFGFEKGSFTGAHIRKIGKLEAAHTGTIFLDEISELSTDLQVNLLRTLQEHRIQRLGSTAEINLNIRVIAATNVDLDEAVREGRFREDLYYRLNVLRVHIPPLRERLEDIELLARHFFNMFVDEKREFIKGFSRGALAAMRRHRWPGNVRELINRVRRALITSDNLLLRAEDLGLEIVTHEIPFLSLERTRAKAEKRVVAKALTIAQNNCSEAARILGVTRATLYRLMCKYQLTRDGEDAQPTARSEEKC